METMTQMQMEMIMSSKEFVDALSNGSNLEAEDAFKSAMSQKIGDALENKRREISKSLCTNCACNGRR